MPSWGARAGGGDTEDLRDAAALMGDAERVANFGSWEWRLRDDHVTWSDQLFRILGFEPGDFRPTLDQYLAHVHPDDRRSVRRQVQEAIDELRPFRFEHRIIRADGEERTLRCLGEPIADEPGGEAVRVIGVAQDVTELVEAEPATDEADARFRRAFENAPVGIALVDFRDGPDGRLTEVNMALAELTGRSERELIASTLPALALREDADLDLALRERLVAGEIDRFSIEKRALLEDRLVWLELQVSALPGTGVGRTQGIVQVQDVTERKRFEDQLRYMADHDSLTGLINRRRFREELETRLALQQRYGGEGAVLLVDVDRLKAINDNRGHGAGDMVLRTVADVMRARTRSTDVVARLAGDEFAVLLPNTSADQAALLAGELIARFGEEEIEGYRISVSIGIASFGDAGGERVAAEDISAAADAAMYRAKQRGGAVAEVAPGPVEPSRAVEGERRPGAEIGSRPSPETTLVARVKAALAADELTLYAQPAVDLRSGQVAHLEVLVRMREESGEVRPAAEFLAAAAQEQGLCAEIDRWVLRRALAALDNGSRGTRLHVNLSGETLTHESALTGFLDDLSQAPERRAWLGLEIGESAIRHSTVQASAAIRRLAATGCPLVLDSFTGAFGSFEYLQRLPLDQVKIEGVITSALLDAQPDHATLRAIVELAQGTGKTTVAKLVESEALVPLLRMHGVDMAQGFELGEPAPLG
jgi:diguanylate cyclase (GGDEF)-like protein/PAS domain S-box-containing protein